MGMSAGFPERFPPRLRMNYAGLPRQEEPLAMASCHKSLQFEDASATTRRLFGLRGGCGRQDALLTEEEAGSLAIDENLENLAAYKKAKKQGAGRKKEDGLPRQGGDKVTGGGQTLHGFNRRTGQRIR